MSHEYIIAQLLYIGSRVLKSTATINEWQYWYQLYRNL